MWTGVLPEVWNGVWTWGWPRVCPGVWSVVWYEPGGGLGCVLGRGLWSGVCVDLGVD